MSRFEVKCTRSGCGQGLETPDVDKMMAWSAAHDERCPSLKAQEIAPEIIAEAEKRGAVNILRHVADRTSAQLTRGEPLAKTVEEAMSQAIEGLRSIAERIERDGMPGIESGEVTLP
jgi:hypothetical protein